MRNSKLAHILVLVIYDSFTPAFLKPFLKVNILQSGEWERGKSDFDHHFSFGKRYVPEKEYIHMISSYITADGLEQYWVKSFGTIVCTISGNVPTNFELQRLKGTLLLKLGEMAAYKR